MPTLRFHLLLSVVLGLGAAAGLTQAADLPPAVNYVVDPSGQLGAPMPPSAAAALAEKLASFERASGIRLLVRFHPTSPSEAEDHAPGAFMRALTAKLGVDKKGVLAVYFADEPDWRVWIGDELAPRFVGKSGTAAEFTASGEMHDVKEAFLATTWAAADAAWTAQQARTPVPEADAKARRLALQTHTLVDALIARLTPAQ